MKAQNQDLLREAVGQAISKFTIELHEFPIGSNHLSDDLMSLAFQSNKSSSTILIRGNSSADGFVIERHVQREVDMDEYGRTPVVPITSDPIRSTLTVRTVAQAPTVFSEEIRFELSNGTVLRLSNEGDVFRFNWADI